MSQQLPLPTLHLCSQPQGLQTVSGPRPGLCLLQVREGQHISPHKLLKLLPAASLPELRVALLERLGRHLEALR